MKVKNITQDPLSVPLLARIVQPGEVVDVPEEQDGAVQTCLRCGQPEHDPDVGHEFEPDDSHRLDWPAGMWEPVKDKPAGRKSDKGSKADEATEAGE